MKKLEYSLSVLLVILGTAKYSFAQFPPFAERVRVVNMIPNNRSAETFQDSEPNIAVDPQNPTNIVGSAFTPNSTGATATAPIFVSRDAGLTWQFRNTVPSNNGLTGDISLAFASQDGALYTGILRGGFGGTTPTRMQLLRTTNAFGIGAMTVLATRDTSDQPFPSAITTGSGASTVDRVYYANNDLGPSKKPRTATIDQSQNARTAAAPAGIAPVRIERRTPFLQDMPPVRVAVHRGGRTYAAYYQLKAFGGSIARCDVIVVRDDNFGTSTPASYAAITDPTDGIAGRIVAANIDLPFSFNNPWLGQNRGASGLSIAVNPNNANVVWIAFCDSVSTVTIHVRRSTDGGANWSGDLLTVNSAMMPALAISSSNVVGVLYQRLNGTTWETHVRRSSTGTTWSDMILATFTDNNPAVVFQPYLGDYCDMVAVGKTFYGVFSSGNIPDNANFPQGVIYQRNANFTTRQLRNVANTANVVASIDPFFFSITPRFEIPVFNICEWVPSLCKLPVFDPGIIRIKCLRDLLCVFPTPIPEICTKVINCPGCEGGTALCPPFYHFYLDDFDPEVWEVEIQDPRGNAIRQELRKTRGGVVLSFRPSKKLYSRKDGIGPYKMVFAPRSGKGDGKEYAFKPRLEVSDYPYEQHLKYGGMK